MTAREKAIYLERIGNLFGDNAPKNQKLFLEAAAHFRGLIPNANGLLPCPMCGADGRPEIFEEIHKGMAWHRGRCGECALITARKYTMPNAIAVWNRRGGVVYE